MLGRVGRIAGQSVAGGITQEQRRIPPPRSSPMPTGEGQPFRLVAPMAQPVTPPGAAWTASLAVPSNAKWWAAAIAVDWPSAPGIPYVVSAAGESTWGPTTVGIVEVAGLVRSVLVPMWPLAGPGGTLTGYFAPLEPPPFDPDMVLLVVTGST